MMFRAALLIFVLGLPFASETFGVTSPDVEDDIREAGRDVAKLHELAKSLTEAKKTSDARKVYKKIIKLEPEDKAAREALRHQYYDGQWFESNVALSKYKRKEAERMKAKGLGRWKDEWVPLADLPFLTMGWKRATSGEWMHPVDQERRKQIESWKAKGYEFRADDNSWIAPEDMDKWSQMLWKCGDDWVDLQSANEFHSELDESWELAGEHFIALTNASWDTGNQARWHADQVHAPLFEIFGVAPDGKLELFIAPSLEGYNQLAAAGFFAETEGLSSVHGAFFSDAAFETTDPMRFLGMGVCYWDRTDESLDAWGACWARWAAAQSYVDAIDRSWVAVSGWIAEEGRAEPLPYGKAFWEEKRIARWLRFGAAGYVERFMPDPKAPEGDARWGLRDFAFQELKKGKGLRPLAKVFEFDVRTSEPEDSHRLYQEAGLLVAYMLDGADEKSPVRKAHAEFKQALSDGDAEAIRVSTKALQKALKKDDKKIRKFAGL